MFMENANLRHPRRRHEFFLRSRPYRGELPAVAGLLLYPDTPAKMETTSHQAFCFRPVPQQDRAQGHLIGPNTQRDFHQFTLTSSKQRDKRSSDKEREPRRGDDEEDDDHTKPTAEKHQQNTLQSQYQKDFPPPSSWRRRRTPALPQPDNIGINPAFRIEFSTAQREAYPAWPAVNHRLVDRRRAASSQQPDKTS